MKILNSLRASWYKLPYWGYNKRLAYENVSRNGMSKFSPSYFFFFTVCTVHFIKTCTFREQRRHFWLDNIKWNMKAVRYTLEKSCALLLRAGWSGDRLPVGARFSAPVQTGPGAHPAYCTVGTVSFLGVKGLGRGVDHLPPSKRRGHERVELYLYSLSVPSWPVIGRTLPLPLANLTADNQRKDQLSYCMPLLLYVTHLCFRTTF